MENSKNLIVGDVIYIVGRNEIKSKLVIERVTKKFAFSKTYKFNISVLNSGYIRLVGRESFSTVSYYLETENLKEQYKREQIIREIFKTDFTKFSTKKLEDLEDIINTVYE